jgi:dTDP-4-amino-4,6-dideoxygalactose transaminase
MRRFDNPIYVTRPGLPPLSKFTAGLQQIWDDRWLTNSGPILRRFERKLKQSFGVSGLSLFTNGTLALIAAMQGLRLEGEVITTPFTFVATTNALLQCGLTPVFADVELAHLNIDPGRVEALITYRAGGRQTSARTLRDRQVRT